MTLRTRRDAIRPSSKRPQPCAVRRAAPSGRRFESVAAMPGDGRSCIRRFNSASESASMAAPATGYKSIQYPPGEHPGRRFAWRPAASDQRTENHRFFAGCRQRQRRKGLKRFWRCMPESFSRWLRGALPSGQRPATSGQKIIDFCYYFSEKSH